MAANENDMAYNADLRICSTVGDFYKLWTALANHTLLRAESFTMMQTASGAAAHMSPSDPQAQYGLALTINHEDAHRRYGQHGSLFGYSGSLYEFPEDHLTIVVLSNTEGQNAYAITRALSRQVLGLPALPPAPAVALSSASRPLDDVPLAPGELRQLEGTFVLAPDRVSSDLHDSYAQYRRTVRVFDENGRLMIQTLGEGPERLLKQRDGTFARRSAPGAGAGAAVTIVVEGGTATTLKIGSASLPLSGRRVGPGDPATFHAQLK